MSTLNNEGNRDNSETRFQVVVSRHSIETTGIRLTLTNEQKANSGIAALWRPDPTPALLTGVAYGPVNLVIRLHPDHLRTPEPQYEDAVIAPVEVTGPISFYGELQTPTVDVPEFHLPLGHHLLQVSSTGADINYDLGVTEASQTITVTLLQSADREPRSLAMGSRAGESFVHSAKNAYRSRE